VRQVGQLPRIETYSVYSAVRAECFNAIEFSFSALKCQDNRS